MDPVLSAILASWDWRADVLITLAVAGLLFTSGWRRLHHRTTSHLTGAARRSGRISLASGWRLLSYWTGLLIIALALLSPIDVLSAQLFTMHMIQHLLLIMIAPPLLLLANPMPFLLWGFPPRIRRRVGIGIGRVIGSSAHSRNTVKSLTGPGLTWMIWVIVIIGWHDPAAYDAALRSEFIHDLEHISFFFVGMLFWWHVTGAGPRLHKQHGFIGRIAFVLSVIPPNMAAGVVIAFASEPIYAYTSGYLGLTALGDQQLGGVIMWIPGSMMYIVAALILASQLLQREERKPSLPESQWGTDDRLVAPGLRQTGDNFR
jgi:cytochrome c oxidase assembly factor CtaG